MADLEPQLHGLRLTTAEVLYHLPDYPEILQTYLWQDYDRPPQFPVLKGVLGFWEQKIDGRLHSIHLTASDLITPGDIEWPEVQINWH